MSPKKLAALLVLAQREDTPAEEASAAALQFVRHGGVESIAATHETMAAESKEAIRAAESRVRRAQEAADRAFDTMNEKIQEANAEIQKAHRAVGEWRARAETAEAKLNSLSTYGQAPPYRERW